MQARVGEVLVSPLSAWIRLHGIAAALGSQRARALKDKACLTDTRRRTIADAGGCRRRALA